MGWTDEAAQGWLYRCVPAPRRAKKGKGHRSAAEALAAAMEAAIAAEAAQGWEYLRTDLLPMESKAGLFSATAESHQGVMVFRRPALPAAAEPDRRAEVRDRRAVEVPRLGAARIE
jgi:hypothetical protein